MITAPWITNANEGLLCYPSILHVRHSSENEAMQLQLRSRLKRQRRCFTRLGALLLNSGHLGSEPKTPGCRSHGAGETRASGQERGVVRFASQLCMHLLQKNLAALILSGNQLLSSARTLGYKLSVPTDIKMIDFNTFSPISCLVVSVMVHS